MRYCCMRALHIIYIWCLLQLATSCCFSQTITTTTARSSIGIDFIMNDYQFNADAKNWSSLRKQVPGVGIHYLRQTNSRYQIAGMLAGTFTDSVVLKKQVTSKKLLIESDVMIQRVLTQPGNVVQPVIGTGIGIQLTKQNISPYVPFNAGLQVNITQEIMLSLTAQYRYSIAGAMRSHALYGIGISGWLPRKKQKKEINNAYQPLLVSVTQPTGDRDHDGINDVDDRCPDVAGLETNHGCPQEKQTKKVDYSFDDSTANVLNTLAKKILFATNSAELKSESFTALKKIYIIIQRYPDLRLLIEGHTDNVGNDNNNLLLSEKRANAVMDYLVKKGIRRDRLKSVGYGESRPITSNDNEEGRSQNRRVVFRKLN